MFIPTYGLIGVLGRYVAAIRAVNRELGTERLLAEMPDHLLKDIGWPDRERIRGRPESRPRGR